MTRRGLVVLGLGSLMSAMTLVAGRADPIGLATEWTGHKAGRVRLLASTVPASGGARIKPARLYAGVHVKLADGWKTYWRQPGEAGVPPGFDWAGSVNVAEARVLFPVPQRLIEAGMTSLGYKHEVVFPVEITPSDPTKPIELKLAFEYGICKDICIPVEAKLSLAAPVGPVAGEAALVRSYLAKVPSEDAAGQPSVTGFKADLAGAAPRFIIDAIFPQGSDGADVLIEVPGGELGPFPVVVERKGRDVVRFEARFEPATEAKRFAGKALLLTLISAKAQAEARVHVP